MTMDDNVRLSIQSFLNFCGIAFVAYLQFRSRREIKENTAMTSHAVTQVSQVKEQTNGRLQALEEALIAAKEENDRLKAELGKRRSSDASI